MIKLQINKTKKIRFHRTKQTFANNLDNDWGEMKDRDRVTISNTKLGFRTLLGSHLLAKKQTNKSEVLVAQCTNMLFPLGLQWET